MNPYHITFHDEAYGGPQHLLYLLTGHVVEFLKQGRSVVVGTVSEVYDDVVTVKTWNDATNLHDGPTRELSIYDGHFDEVMYL